MHSTRAVAITHPLYTTVCSRSVYCLQAKLEPGGQQCGTAPSSDDNSIQAVLTALRQATLQCHEQQDACTDITNTHAAAGSRSSSSSSDSSTQKGLDLGPLLELCPAGISSRFLQHCVQHSLQGDLQVRRFVCCHAYAGFWLLPTGHICAAEMFMPPAEQHTQRSS